MPPPEDTPPQEGVIKSTHHDWPSYITFINRTSDPVDVIWRDYQGNCVCFRRALVPGQPYAMNTFVTHPWQAWYSNTYEKVTVGGDFVFMPRPWRGEQNRTEIYIDRPVLSLLKLSLRTVRSLVPRDDVEELEIPKDLHFRLKRRKTPPAVRDVHRFQTHH